LAVFSLPETHVVSETVKNVSDDYDNGAEYEEQSHVDNPFSDESLSQKPPPTVQQKPLPTVPQENPTVPQENQTVPQAQATPSTTQSAAPPSHSGKRRR